FGDYLPEIDNRRFELVGATIEALDHGELIHPLLWDTSISIRIDILMLDLPLLGNMGICFLETFTKRFAIFFDPADQTFDFIHRPMERNNRCGRSWWIDLGIGLSLGTLMQTVHVLGNDPRNDVGGIPAR